MNNLEKIRRHGALVRAIITGELAKHVASIGMVDPSEIEAAKAEAAQHIGKAEAEVRERLNKLQGRIDRLEMADRSRRQTPQVRSIFEKRHDAAVTDPNRDVFDAILRHRDHLN